MANLYHKLKKISYKSLSDKSYRLFKTYSNETLDRKY